MKEEDAVMAVDHGFTSGQPGRLFRCLCLGSSRRARPRAAEEKKELAEMNLTDHAGVRLTHGKPKVNGVEIHYALGGAGAQVARDVRGAVIPASGHNIALENPAALAQVYLDFFAGG
jgi:hypothetical protein